MISLEQVSQLEIRVRKAVGVIKTLKAENAVLKQRVAALEGSLEVLEQEASSRKADEQRLELSLQGVLNVLDEMETEEPESSFEASIVQPEGADDSENSEETPVDETDEVNEEEEKEILSEPEDIDFVSSAPDAATETSVNESELDESVRVDDDPEEINLDESVGDDTIEEDETLETGSRDDRVQSEFDIF